MPSLFNEYRTLLELLDAVVDQHIVWNAPDQPLTMIGLHQLLREAIEQVDAVEAKAS